MASNIYTPPFESNEDLWFDDGDIHVCARRLDSGALCLYKLYRDILAVHSTSLLTFLDKSIARRQFHIGNTPYAYLPGHDALDLERFFIAIYYPTYIFFCKQNSRTFTRALPVFRIALKFEANNVIEALASQLEQDWPQTLSEWDASQYEDGACVEPFGYFGPESWSSNRVAAVMEPASAIKVARIANMPSVLCTAYYQLSRTSISNLDGSTLLSKEDLRRLALGKERLSRYMLSFKKRLLQEFVLHPRCADAWNAGVAMRSDDPLADLLELCSAKAFPGGDICGDCRSLINESGREERARVWKILPQLFCFPVCLLNVTS